MSELGYWRRPGSGFVWAVETEDGCPVKCSGPLDPSDAERAVLPYFNYGTTYLMALRAEWPSLAPYVPTC